VRYNNKIEFVAIQNLISECYLNCDWRRDIGALTRITSRKDGDEQIVKRGMLQVLDLR